MECNVVLKRFQQTAAELVLGGKDVFVCLPTGSGKTFCYAFLPDLVDGNIIVISPLIAKSEPNFAAVMPTSDRTVFTVLRKLH